MLRQRLDELRLRVLRVELDAQVEGDGRDARHVLHHDGLVRLEPLRRARGRHEAEIEEPNFAQAKRPCDVVKELGARCLVLHAAHGEPA